MSLYLLVVLNCIVIALPDFKDVKIVKLNHLVPISIWWLGQLFEDEAATCSHPCIASVRLDEIMILALYETSRIQCQAHFEDVGHV